MERAKGWNSDMNISKNIEKKGNKFFLYGLKYLGDVAHIKQGKVFITHTKKPEAHFYVKGQGYAINEELLQVLDRAGIEYILIPEDGKTGFRVYLTKTKDYLRGESIIEPKTEPQRVIPLKECIETKLRRIDLENLRR